MKNLRISAILLCMLIISVCFVTASENVEAPSSCKYCSMDRTRFAHSRMLITYQDGSTAGTCSLHCAAVELASNIDKMPKSIMVGDYNSKKLIDAEAAYWVIGGDKMGVMSTRAKWAFGSRADAEAYLKAHHGTLGTFDDAIRAAYEDMYKDTKMIRERRNMMKMKHGEHH